MCTVPILLLACKGKPSVYTDLVYEYININYRNSYLATYLFSEFRLRTEAHCLDLQTVFGTVLHIVFTETQCLFYTAYLLYTVL